MSEKKGTVVPFRKRPVLKPATIEHVAAEYGAERRRYRTTIGLGAIYALFAIFMAFVALGLAHTIIYFITKNVPVHVVRPL